MAANWLLGGWSRALPQSDSEVEQHARVTASSEESSPGTSPLRRATWPLFETPAISLLKVGGYEIYNGIAYFVVIVKMSGFQWKSLKSYEDFSTLNRILVEEDGLERSLFPTRRLFGSMKQEYLAELQGKLSAYLFNLLKCFTLPPHVLLDFLEYKYNDILSITETLSMLFYQRGDEYLQADCMVAFSPLQLHCICQRKILPIATKCNDMRRDFGHLMDFLQHLRKLKVTHPSKETFPMSPSVELLIDFSIAKSLIMLVLKSVQLDIIQSFGDLPGQLLVLKVHHSLNSISDILQHSCLFEDSDSEGKHTTEDRNMQWSQLKVADFSYNTISRIDSSVRLAPNLEELNLSDNVIAEIENLDLPHLQFLSMANNQIHSLESLNQRLGNITTLCIAKNRISSLEGLRKCYSITYLDVQDNLIEKAKEVSHLSKLPLLEQLMIRGNPFTLSPSYRTQVFSYLLKTAKQLSLDGRLPSKDELEVSARPHVTVKPRRTSSREANIMPEIEDESECPNEIEPLPLVSIGTRRELEQIRRQGGENWLSLLNKDKGLQPTSAPKLASPRKHSHRQERRQQRRQRHCRDHSLSSPSELETSSSPDIPERFIPRPLPSSGLPSQQLADIIKNTDVSKRSTWSTRVNVMEYPGSLDELSHTDFEQLLSNSSMEECLLTVDLTMNRITEDFGSGGRVNQRDILVLKNVRVHEGSRLAVSLQFMSLVSQQAWVVYCLKDRKSIAELYSILTKKCKEASEASPVLPSRPFAGINDDDDDHPLNVPFQKSHSVKSASPDHSLPVLQKPTTDRVKPTSLDLGLPSHAPSTNENSIVEQESSSQQKPSSSPDHSLPVVQEPTADHVEPTLLNLGLPIHAPPSNESSSGEQESPIGSSEQAAAQATSNSEKEMAPEPEFSLEKPGLDNLKLHNFFKSSISLEKGEVLMYVAWCGASMMCTTPYEIEVGIFVSNHSIYFCEVQPSLGSSRKQTSWSQDSLPLACVLSANLEQVSRVTVLGVFDQNIHIEVRDKSLVQSIVLFPPTIELTYQILEQLKAAFDAAGLHYEVTEAHFASKLKGISGVVMVNPDNSTLEKLKEHLVRDKAMIRMGNFVATQKNTSLVGSVDLELRRYFRDLANTFDIAQQLVVYVTCTDSFPFSNGKLCLMPMTLVLTSDTLYLCQESFVLGPLLHPTPAKNAFPHFQVVRSQPTALVTSVRICDKAQFLQSPSDLVYQFSLSFKDSSDRDHSSCQWHFCVHNQQYLGRFVNSLRQHWKSVLMRDLPVVRTTEQLTYFQQLKQPVLPVLLPVAKSKSSSPLLVQSKPLLHFVTMSHSSKQKVFKERIAQADYVKSDEMILSTFLCHCQPAVNKKAEIEAVTIVSNYAVYVLSDIDNIRCWLDVGGVSSFARMSLLNAVDIMGMQCFYRVWLNDITRIKLGLLHLSLKLIDIKADCSIDILTQNIQSTMSCVAALSRSVQLKDPSVEQQVSQIISEFVDIAVDPFGESPTEEVASLHLDRRRVEFVVMSEQQLNDLKLHLVESNPAVARNSSVKKCALSMQLFSSQLVLLAEQLRIRDTQVTQYRPHLLIITNYGLYLCVNTISPDISPCVFSHALLAVKKWIRIDDIDRVQVSEDTQHKIPQLLLYLRSGNKGKTVVTHMCFIPQNLELADIFIHYLSLLWSERMGQELPVEHLV